MLPLPLVISYRNIEPQGIELPQQAHAERREGRDRRPGSKGGSCQLGKNFTGSDNVWDHLVGRVGAEKVMSR